MIGAAQFWTGRIVPAAKWLIIILPMASLVGSLCALFLWALEIATRSRFDYPWLLFGLPVAGLGVGLAYHWFGRSAEGGNNLIVEQIHEPGGGVPLRMAPLILIGTVVTHLFGGSAGREGTAVQLGGSIAGAFGKAFKLEADDIRVVLMAGIAAGFGAVFGTPIAGAIFALEVLTMGRIQYEALIPCLLAAIIGDWTCHIWGIEHTPYHIAYLANPTQSGGVFHIQAFLLLKVAIAAVGFGLAGRVFAELSHSISALFKKFCPYAPLRPLIGGLLVIGLVYATGTREYLGLGVWSPNPNDITIARLFDGAHIEHWAWALKILFTVVTLGAGFKGGEVTPLFFIGAALGNALSGLLGAPTDLFAALGFVAIFAGASNTPLACTIMGIELFGSTHTVYIAVACFLAYVCSGHSGIYLSQRIGVPKIATGRIPPDLPLRHVRTFEPSQVDRLIGYVRPIKSRALKLVNGKESESMQHAHRVTAQEIGMLRIYLKPGDRVRSAKSRIFSHRPLYRQLVLAAKSAGIINAVAHHTHFGFSNHGEVEASGVEVVNPHLTMCVELIGERDRLELFCRQNGEHLQSKVVIFKHLERWQIDSAKPQIAEPAEEMPLKEAV